MTKQERQTLIYRFIEECERDHSKMLTGDELEQKIRSDSGDERNKVRDDLSEVLDRLYKNGRLSDAFCDKIVENNNCPNGFQGLLGRNFVGRKIQNN